MRNPWLDLPEEPSFVLPADRELVAWLNDNSPPERQIITSSLPEPWVGDPRRAKVLILSLNPGHKPDKDGEPGDAGFFSRPEVHALIIRNLFHAVADLYHLRPSYYNLPGGRWWRRTLRHLITDCGLDLVRFSVAAVELFPYHSQQFAYHGRIASVAQAYTRELIIEAIDAKKVIVVTRSLDHWTCAVPELLQRDRVIRLQNERPRMPVRVHPETCAFGLRPYSRPPSQEAYDMIVEAIRA